MEYTTHAIHRCSQRGIRQQQVQWLLEFGCHTWNRGAQVYFFDRARLKRLLLKLSSAERQLAEKAQKVYVVVVDGAVVTVGHRSPDFCVSKPGAHHHRRRPQRQAA